MTEPASSFMLNYFVMQIAKSSHLPGLVGTNELGVYRFELQVHRDGCEHDDHRARDEHRFHVLQGIDDNGVDGPTQKGRFGGENEAQWQSRATGIM